MFIDSHAHLNDDKLYSNVEEIIENSKINNVDIIICSSYDYESSKRALQICQNHKNVFCSLGIHPHDAKSYTDEVEQFIINNAQNSQVKAIGEIGLDYYYDLSPREIQKEVFKKQILLAHKLGLPVVIHTRDSIGDTLSILKEYESYLTNGVLIHCFNASLKIVKIINERGYYVSFGGAITFKNAKNLIEVVKNIPLERILLETDCPYMTPEPYRGKINEPKNIPIIAKKLAEIKEISVEIVQEVTTKNAKKFFNIGEK